MKWLVQTLDLLSSHCPEQEAIGEQKKLEALITRYKNLIPTIEITMVKTEVYSKCYTYRREVREVCTLLKRVKDQSTATTQPESLENINQQIKQQEVAVSQLDQQRSNIMSMLQRGKDLMKDTNAPTFIKDEVRILETGWNEAYDETVDRLKKLKGTQKLWSNYSQQKDEILELLARAEQELKRISPGQYNLSNITADLQAKQDMSIHLREATEDMLKKLRDLCSSLATLTSPEKKPQLQKEVADIEERLQSTMQVVEERVVHMHQFSTKWTSFQSRLGDLQQWTVQNAPALLSAVQAEDISPEERVRKTSALQGQLIERLNVLQALHGEATHLVPVECEHPDAMRVRSDIVALQDRVTALNRSVESQSSAVTKDLANWQQYQAGLQDIKPWVEQAEVRVTMGMAKPLTLQEAVRMQHEAKLFERDCEAQLAKLQAISMISQQMSCKTNAPDEVDAVHSRWTSVHDTAVQWANKYDKLVGNWKDFDSNATKLEKWIVDNEKSLAKHTINLNTPQVDKLESDLVKLKAFNNALSEQQAKLITLTQNSDSISHSLTLEGASAVKGRVADMKAKVTQMAEAVRGKINEVSDAILARQEFQTKMTEFTNWMDQLGGNIAQVDEINFDKVDASLQTVHALLQEHSDKQPLFSLIYEEVKNLSLQSSPEEQQLLNETYTALVQNYKDLENNLQQKKAALEKWAELLNWHDEAAQQLSHIKYQIESQKAQPEDLEKLITEIDTVLKKVTVWQKEVPAIDSVASVQIRDKSTGKPISANVLVRDIEVRGVNLKSRLGNKIEVLQKLGAHWNHFQQLQKDATDNVSSTHAKLLDIVSKVTTCNALEQAVQDVSHLLDTHQAMQPLKEQLHEEGEQLMKEDQGNVTVIQKTLSTIDANWDKVNELLKEQHQKYSEMSATWKEFQEAKTKADKEIEKANKMCDDIITPNDSTEASFAHEKAKKAMEILKKSKAILDKMDAKGQGILKKSESITDFEPQIRSELDETHAHWTSVYERILKVVQVTESQAIIWKQIDETKNNLLSWLSETNEVLNNALQRPADVEAGQAKLLKYVEELPSYVSLKQSIITKYTQLRKMNNDKSLPTLDALVKLLDDQFADVQSTADKLESVTSTFGEQERGLRAGIKNLGNNISELRESIIKCEDLSGDNTKVLDRLLKCQRLQQQLNNCNGGLEQIHKSIEELKLQYPSVSESNLPKEYNVVKKRYEGVMIHANKIEGALLAFLKKCHQDKQNALQRIVSAQKEKVQWCLPEPSSDRYNLEVKLGSLIDVENGLVECEAKKSELEHSLQLLESVETPETISQLTTAKNQLIGQLNDLKKEHASTKDLLQRNIDLWQKYELSSENIASWLKDTETKIRSESINQLNLATIGDKIKEVKAIQKHVSDFNKDMKDLITLGDNMVKEIPESRIGQYISHLSNRYQAVVKFVSNYLERLEALNVNRNLYQSSVKDVENWLADAEKKVNKFSEFTAPGSKPNKGTLEQLKKFAEEREKGQALLNKAVEHGEALFLGITPENRETIRTELRKLRDASEALADRVNSIYKQVETILLQRSSWDDSFSQVKQWVVEANTKLGQKMELNATLPEKKATLHNYRSIAQEVNIHKNILKQLKDKVENLSDSEADSKLNESLENYNKLSDEVTKRIALAEKYVLNHEAYIQALEKSRDWLSALTAEAMLLLDESSTDDADAKLAIVENLLQQKPEGDKIINSCKAQMQTVLEQTAITGHPALLKAFEEQEQAWNAFLQLCSDAQTKLNQLHSQWAEYEKVIDGLEAWIKQKESQVKDQSLRNTQEAKQAHLDKLKSLEEEILSKGDSFDQALEQSQGIEGESELSVKVSHLLTRYKTLKNNAKEAIARYESFVKEHKAFNEDYAKFLKWLSDRETELQDLSHIVGDFNILQDRQKKVRYLIDTRSKESVRFESLIDRGEKLYAHTSPDGREIIRQQLRNLRTIWDSFSDDLQSATNKLDQCLMQFQDFTASQEQLTKWLKDVERAMHQHTELKATLQEKRAQLQNHKIMHQEIMSHQQLVESVCDKAQQLVDQTQDTSLNIYLQSIKQLFQNIVSKSQDLLDNLDECVDKHNQFNVLCHNFRDWMNRENEKLQECDDISGEKSDIAKRVMSIKALRENETEGNKMLDEIRELFGVVSKSTAPKGNDELEKEIDEMQNLLKQYLEDLGKYNIILLVF